MKRRGEINRLKVRLPGGQLKQRVEPVYGEYEALPVNNEKKLFNCEH